MINNLKTLKLINVRLVHDTGAMMELVELTIPGCYLVLGERHEDSRGDFCKIFHAPRFSIEGLESNFVETYITTSTKGVVRGMHFQVPPHDHAKLVCCIQGEVRDGLVDLRRGSPTYKQSCSVMLSEDVPSFLYIPRGVAHGFATYKTHSRMLYLVSSAYEKTADSGVRWDSVGIKWWDREHELGADIIVSERDKGFQTLANFSSPFEYKNNAEK